MDEEPQGGDVNKEQLAKKRREQDKVWEDSRVRELGRNAILGPTASPKKRINEIEEGAGAGDSKRKRRKLEHEVLQEGWGELPLRGGAGQDVPGAALVELELPSSPREQSSTPTPVEQCTPTQLRGSRITSEQPLVQLEITTFFNPAPSE